MAAWTIPVGRQVCYNVELTIEKAVSIMSIDQLTSTQIMETSPDAGSMTQEELIEEINRLRKERNAVILAHNYQIPVIQDIADFTGDSLGLARQAAKTDADLIVFCGVHFMAETAAILCPDKKVLLPDLEAGCSLADTITVDQLREWKKQHPGAVVVAYVNTSAAVKAESDICCTSSNAVEVVQSIPEDKEILFLPDMFLGSYVEKMTGRKMHIWMGECHVHAAIHPDEVQELAEKHPEAELLIHPECGCSTSAMYEVAAGGLPSNTALLSTGKMIKHVAQSPAETFIVATEVGILHRLQQENPAKRFVPASEHAVCPFMKMITLEKVYRSLRDDIHVIEVDPDTAARARRAIERMLEIG